MNNRIGKVVQFVASAAAAVYLYWRWADFSAWGDPIGFRLAIHVLFVAVPFWIVAVVAYLNAPKSPVRAIAAALALAVSLCFLWSMAHQLMRFLHLGGPASKEMAELAWKMDLLPGTAGQWIKWEAIRMRREFCSTAVIAALLFAYLFCLSAVHGRKQVNGDTHDSSPPPGVEA
jgi:hypothetical protein